MKRHRWPLGAGDVSIILLSVIAGTSLITVLSGHGLWLGAVSGAAVATGSLILQHRFKLLLLEWAALSMLAFVIVGGWVVGSTPSPSSYRMFLRGVIGGWADLLSSVPPVGATGEMAALPYALSWLAAMIGFALVRHVRFPVVAALGPVGVFGVGLLFSVELRTTSLIQGAVLAALTLALGWYQQRNLGFEIDEEIGNTTVARRRSRILWAAAVLVGTSLVAPFVAPSAPGMADRERFDLREALEPPWNPLDEPSPLAQISSNYLEATRDDVVFVVRGDSIPRRWSLATLAAYDGTVWTVGDVDVDGAAEFIPLDRLTPEGASGGTLASSAEQTLEIEVMDVDFPWLPLTGTPLAIDAAGDSPTDVRFNSRTRTAAVPTGSANVTFRLETAVGNLPSEAALEEATFAVGNPDQTVAVVRNWTADIVEGADAGWPQVAAIRDALRNGGYLSDERSSPGHSWARLTEFFEQEAFYGNEEQYGAVAAIAARNSGLKSRVTVGYLIDAQKLDAKEIAVTKNEATAWLEVLTEEYGWVQVDVTPSRDNEPTIAEAGTTTRDVAAPNPPPPPPPPPLAPRETDQADADDEEEEEGSAEDGAGIPAVAIAAGAAVTLPMLLIGLWLGGLGLIKARRRSRRRKAADPNRRMTGAWLELIDRLDEVDRVRAVNPSVIELAGLVEETIPAAFGTLEVARLVDRSAFGPGIDDAEATEAWNRCDAIVHKVSRSASRTTRVARLADPRPVLAGGRTGGGR